MPLNGCMNHWGPKATPAETGHRTESAAPFSTLAPKTSASSPPRPPQLLPRANRTLVQVTNDNPGTDEQRKVETPPTARADRRWRWFQKAPAGPSSSADQRISAPNRQHCSLSTAQLHSHALAHHNEISLFSS